MGWSIGMAISPVNRYTDIVRLILFIAMPILFDIPRVCDGLAHL